MLLLKHVCFVKVNTGLADHVSTQFATHDRNSGLLSLGITTLPFEVLKRFLELNMTNILRNANRIPTVVFH